MDVYIVSRMTQSVALLRSGHFASPDLMTGTTLSELSGRVDRTASFWWRTCASTSARVSTLLTRSDRGLAAPAPKVAIRKTKDPATGKVKQTNEGFTKVKITSSEMLNAIDGVASQVSFFLV